MIRTAVPFGYLFIALFFLAMFVAGLVTFIVSWRRRSTRGRWLGAALCAFAVLAVAAEIADDSALEWNPTIGDDAQIIGTWVDRGQTLALAADHTFTYQAASQKIHGTWERDDWNLRLRGGGTYADEMRFVQFRGVTRLMPHPPEDPDAWDGDLGLRLVRHR